LHIPTTEECVRYAHPKLPPIAGGAGWSYVKGASANVTNAGTTGASVAFGSNVASGNVLVTAAIYASNVTPTWTFSDTQGNGWTQLGQYTDPTTASCMSAGFAIAGSSAADTPKWVNNQATSVTCDIFIGEFVPPSGTISQDGAATTAAGTTDPFVTPAGGGSGSNDLVINVLCFAFNWTSWGGAWASMAGAQSGNIAGYLINAAGNSTPNTPTAGNAVASMVVALKASTVDNTTKPARAGLFDPELNALGVF
jgi:hypothetical protein